MVRRTSRRSGADDSPKKKTRSGRGGLRGQAGREQLEKELERQKAKEEARKNQVNKPYTFWMPDGDTREVCILDDEPYFFRYEHNLKDPRTGKFGLNILCKRDEDNCPICTESGKEGQYIMYLSVLDLKPYTNKDGVEVEFTRKLFAVKSQQQKKFIRRFEKDGTLRGAIYELSRDGAKSPVIGNDIEFLEFMDEEELSEYERTWKDRDGKRHTEDCSQPFDYDEIMPDQSIDEICDEYEEAYGKRPKAPPGSSRDNEEDNYDEVDEEVDEEEEEESRSSRRRKPSRRSARKREEENEIDEDAEENWEDEEEEDDGEPPFDVDEDDEEEEEEKPKRRSRAKPKAKAKAKAKPTRRSRKAADEDEDEEEEAPARTKRRPVRRRSK